MTYSGYSSAAYTYSYDARGNITAVYKGGTLQASYVYDDLNQLVRENNVAANKTWVYTYDERGNILSRKTYAYTTGTLGTVQNTDSYEYFEQSSSYLWGDGLVRYNSGFNVYDAIGNPTQYENGNTFYFTWQNGRQLASGTKGNTSFAYTYNADGLRTKKVVGNTTTTYYWAGTQLVAMTVDDGTTPKTLKFYYDAEGRPFCFDLDGEIYFYITNLQGDVMQIVSESGSVYGWYEYDAWGKLLTMNGSSSSIAEALLLNPLRYRGYIYDSETEFYYLQSRYYDPTVGRFINADGYVSTGQGILGHNMFAYCGNNPVYRVDNEGKFWKKAGAFFEKIVLAALYSIECEVGFGYGLGLSQSMSGAEVSAELYSDVYSVRLDDGDAYTVNSGGASLGVSYADQDRLSLAVGSSYIHEYHDRDCECTEHYASSNPFDVAICEHADSTPFGLSIPIFGKIGADCSSDFVIGFSTSAHIIVGGHASAGFNISEFFRELTSDEHC